MATSGARSARLEQLLARRPIVEVARDVEISWRMTRHGFYGPSDVTPEALARAHCGLHAARQLTPWVTLHARLPDVEASVLRDAIRGRRLLRLRCMRRTLHLVPRDLAPVVHVATLSQRLPPCRLAVERSGLSSRAWAALHRSVRIALADAPLPYRELETSVLTQAPRAVRIAPRPHEFARLAIKTMWERGELLVGDASPSLHHEHRTFALTEQAVPDLDLNAIDTPEAVATLLRHYLDSFGPVGTRDFAWWSGVALRDALPAWEALVDQLVRVRITGGPARHELVALRSTIDSLESYGAQEDDSVQVLAYEDPALKGYFVSRWRYADRAHMGKLFNTIGEVRASVLLRGRVVAVWHWDRKAQRPTIEMLGRPSAKDLLRVRARVEQAAVYLRAEPLLR